MMSTTRAMVTTLALKGKDDSDVTLIPSLSQCRPCPPASTFMSTFANSDKADGGNRQEMYQPQPPYGWNVGMRYLQRDGSGGETKKQKLSLRDSNSGRPRDRRIY